MNGALSHSITRLEDGYKDRIGRWTDFVEVGPMVVTTPETWRCILEYIDPSTGSGYGVDYTWCKMIAGRCPPSGDSSKVCAILDAFSIDHESTRISFRCRWHAGTAGVREVLQEMEYSNAYIRSARLESIGDQSLPSLSFVTVDYKCMSDSAM